MGKNISLPCGTWSTWYRKVGGPGMPWADQRGHCCQMAACLTRSITLTMVVDCLAGAMQDVWDSAVGGGGTARVESFESSKP